MPPKAKAVFFDRDGTLIEDRDYLATPDGVAMLPHAAQAVRELARGRVQGGGGDEPVPA